MTATLGVMEGICDWGWPGGVIIDRNKCDFVDFDFRLGFWSRQKMSIRANNPCPYNRVVYVASLLPYSRFASFAIDAALVQNFMYVCSPLLQMLRFMLRIELL